MVDVANASIDIPGVRIGHWTDGDARTGCTVVRFDGPAVASGEVRGGAPATREFALLDPRRSVADIDAVVLTGGSAFGLASCDGVVRQLEVEGVGFETKFGRVPIVVGMALYDLGVGRADRRPDAEAGRAATAAAAADSPIGAVGAGTGATVAKWRGEDAARAGGLGLFTASDGDVSVLAVVAVNAAGDLAVDHDGAETTSRIARGEFDWPEIEGPFGENTTIGVLATDARLDKVGCRALAEAGHDGLARALVPAHSPSDGDALVAVSVGDRDAALGRLRMLGAVAVEHAIASVRST